MRDGKIGREGQSAGKSWCVQTEQKKMTKIERDFRAGQRKLASQAEAAMRRWHGGKPRAHPQKRWLRPRGYFRVHDSESYRRYLLTNHWKGRRKLAIRVLGKTCSICGRSVENPQVHHKDYRRLWREQVKDLCIVHRTCHKMHHFGIWPGSLEDQHMRAICAAC